MSRKRKTKAILLNLSAELLERIDLIIERTGESRRSYIERALVDHLDLIVPETKFIKQDGAE